MTTVSLYRQTNQSQPSRHKAKNMKITIELDAQEVKGIKQYISSDKGNNKASKEDIAMYIRSIVDGVIYNPNESISEYIGKKM